MMVAADQDHVVLHDGVIVSVHGAVHPPGHLIGEVVYLPDEAGSHRLLGRGYRKAYQKDGRGIAEADRFRIRDPTGTFVDTAALYDGKSIIDLGRVARFIPCADVTTGPAPELAGRLWDATRRLLGIPGDDLRVALTGSLNLDPHPRHVLEPNDVDLVFSGSTAAVGALVAAMSRAAKTNPGLRVYDYGKGWQIRLRVGDALLCSFFRYENAVDAPLRDLTGVRTVAEDVRLLGTVTDDDHNVFMPMIVEVEVESADPPDVVAPGTRVPVVIHHLRSRGDFFRGDRGDFRGKLLDLSQGAKSGLVLSVVDGTSSTLLTPPWDPY